MEVPPPHPRAPWLVFGQWMGVCILEGFGPGDDVLITLCVGLIFLAESFRETTKISLECGSKTLGRSSNNTWNFFFFFGGGGLFTSRHCSGFLTQFFFLHKLSLPCPPTARSGCGRLSQPLPTPASSSQLPPFLCWVLKL